MVDQIKIYHVCNTVHITNFTESPQYYIIKLQYVYEVFYNKLLCSVFYLKI